MTPLDPTLTIEALQRIAARPQAPWLLIDGAGAIRLTTPDADQALAALDPVARDTLTDALRRVLDIGAPSSQVILPPVHLRVEGLPSGGLIAWVQSVGPASLLDPAPTFGDVAPPSLDVGALRDMIEAMIGDFTMIEVIPGRAITAVGRWAVSVPASALPTVLDAICGLLHPDDAPRARDVLGAAWTVPEDFDLSVRARASVGEGYRWRLLRGRALTDPSGALRRLLCVDVDMTEARDSSHDLALARQLIEESATALWAASPDGRLILLNEAARTLSGVANADLRGRLLWQANPRLTEAQWHTSMERLRAGGHQSMDIDVETEAGHTLTIRSTARLIQIDGAEVVVGSVVELNATRRLEELRETDRFLAELSARLMRSPDDGLQAALLEGLEQLGRRAGAFIARVMDYRPGDPPALVERVRWEDPAQTRPSAATVRPAPIELQHIAPGDLLYFSPPGAPAPKGLEELEGYGMASAGLYAGELVLGTLCLGWNPEGWARRHELTEQLLLRVAELFARTLDRLRLNQDAKAHRAQLNAVLRNIPGFAYRARLDDDCAIVLITEGVQALLGVSAPSLIGAPLAALIAPEDHERIRAARRALGPGAQGTLEYRLTPTNPSPQVVWGLEHYTVTQDPADGALYLDGLITDITERHVAVEVRDLFFSQLDVPMVVSNLETDLLAWNSAFARLVGYTDEELRGQRFIGFLAPAEEIELAQRQVSTQVRLDEPRFRDVVHKLRRKDGREVIVSWTGYLDMREPMRSFNMARDLTALSEAEEAARRRDAQLQQAQRLESLGVMAGGLAHDFNNLIAVVLAGLELVSRQVTDRPTALRQLGRMRAAMERSAQLVAQLLAFGRRQVTQRQPLDLNQLIEDRLDLLRGTIPADISVELSLGSSWAILADPTQLEQALMNLVVNALDAMPGGGRLEICTADRSLAPIEAAALRVEPGDYVSLTVRDTGTGMSDEVRERIFDPFFTTKPMGQGTGLGLPSTYGIITAHGGAVTVDTTLGLGSAFELLLPVSAAVPELAPPVADPEPDRPHNERLLIVEDNDDLRELVGDVLSLAGYEVHLAQDSVRALTLLAEHRFHLLITDVVMPGGNGVELVRIATADDPSLKTITMSGYAWTELVQAKRLPPDAHFLRKPFQNAELLRLVSEVLAAG
ncbi:PAS domain S-box protein [Myxococcota bacterium]|nr:PAS domain S-box protein [Myxococcota bacterium]